MGTSPTGLSHMKQLVQPGCPTWKKSACKHIVRSRATSTTCFSHMEEPVQLACPTWKNQFNWPVPHGRTSLTSLSHMEEPDKLAYPTFFSINELKNSAFWSNFLHLFQNIFGSLPFQNPTKTLASQDNWGKAALTGGWGQTSSYKVG